MVKKRELNLNKQSAWDDDGPPVIDTTPRISAWGDDGPPVGDKIHKIIQEHYEYLNKDLQGAFGEKPSLKEGKWQDFHASYQKIIANNQLKLHTQIQKLIVNKNSEWGQDGPPVIDILHKIIEDNSNILNKDLQGAFGKKPILTDNTWKNFQARYPEIIADNQLKLRKQIQELFVNSNLDLNKKI
jgi:hypothetical protein